MIIITKDLQIITRALRYWNYSKGGLQSSCYHLAYEVIKGGENVLVADYMIHHRGLGRGSYLTGASKFNTRYIIIVN